LQRVVWKISLSDCILYFSRSTTRHWTIFKLVTPKVCDSNMIPQLSTSVRRQRKRTDKCERGN
jgi:hypothetical protein